MRKAGCGSGGYRAVSAPFSGDGPARGDPSRIVSPLLILPRPVPIRPVARHGRVFPYPRPEDDPA